MATRGCGMRRVFEDERFFCLFVVFILSSVQSQYVDSNK